MLCALGMRLSKTVPCGATGCEARVPPKELGLHRAQCEFREALCGVPSCPWKGPCGAAFLEHLRATHAAIVLPDDAADIEFAVDKNSLAVGDWRVWLYRERIFFAGRVRDTEVVQMGGMTFLPGERDPWTCTIPRLQMTVQWNVDHADVSNGRYVFYGNGPLINASGPLQVVLRPDAAASAPAAEKRSREDTDTNLAPTKRPRV